MITLGQFATMLSTSLVILLIPGPSVLFVISRGVALGRRAALASVAGNSTGAIAHAFAAAVGVSALVTRSTAVFTAIKIAGALYLLYLGIKSIRGRSKLADVMRDAATVSDRHLYLQGLVVGLSNPKIPLFFLAVLPQFVEPSHGHPGLQMLVFGLTFVALGTITDSSYGLAAGSIRTWLERSPRRLSVVGGMSGLALIGLGINIALTGRKD
jgi:threonine/homoserine/homoserine lactone efflux protein